MNWMNLIMMPYLKEGEGMLKEPWEKEIKKWVWVICVEGSFMVIIPTIKYFYNELFIQSKSLLLLDESDDEDSRPARKRRLAERAAEGMEVEDEQVILP